MVWNGVKNNNNGVMSKNNGVRSKINGVMNKNNGVKRVNFIFFLIFKNFLRSGDEIFK